MSESAAIPVPRRDDPTARTIAAFALGVALFVGTVLGWAGLPQRVDNGTVASILWLNTFIVIVAIVVEARRRPYSLHLMHLVCMFLFMGAAAVYQYTVGVLAVAGPVGQVRGQLITAALTITFWLFGYILAYEIHHHTFKPKRQGFMARYLTRPLTKRRVSVMLGIGLVVLAYLAAVGLAGVGTRAASRDALAEASSRASSGFGVAMLLVHEWILRAFPMVAVLAATLVFVRDRASRNIQLLLLVVVGFAANALGNNPFAASRMWFATAVIAFAAPFFLRRLRTGWGIVTIAVAGLTILPALNFNRYAETIGELADYFALVSPATYLARSSDVDSLGMTALCAQWTAIHGHTYGLQIVGALVSFFPRAFWPNKPIGTGKMVTEDLGFEFTNLSPSIPAEALVDFGLLGVPFFAALVALLFSRLDQIYWNRPNVHSRFELIDCIYPFWVGCVIYITRGDLFGAYAMTAGFTVCIVPIAFAARPRRTDSPSGETEPIAHPGGLGEGS